MAGFGHGCEMSLKDYLALLFVIGQAVLTLAFTMAAIGLVLGLMYGLTKHLFLFGLRVMT